MRIIRTLMLMLALGASPGWADIVCPEDPTPIHQKAVVDVVMASGMSPLGAYAAIITYDPHVLAVDGVMAIPPFNVVADTSSRGIVRIDGFQTASLTSPTGMTAVARLTFRALRRPRSIVGLTVRYLFDTNAVALALPRPTTCDLRTVKPPHIH